MHNDLIKFGGEKIVEAKKKQKNKIVTKFTILEIAKLSRESARNPAREVGTT